MKRVVFFGSIGVAKRILEEIVLTRDIALVGVCCQKMENTWRADEGVYEFCQRNGIPILDDDYIVNAKPDLGISVRYNRIIRESVINAFKHGIVNTHGGILPEYRGSYCNINAIINGETEFGVTLHYIDTGIDTGDIIDIKRVKICDNDTGFDLYRASEELCYNIIDENIDSLLSGCNIRTCQEVFIKHGHSSNTYFRKTTIAKRYIEFSDLGNDMSIPIIRAFDSPMHEPAYTMINGRRVFLRVKK